LKKYADCDHATIVNKFEEEENALVRGTFERKKSKKKKNILGSAIFKFIFYQRTFLKR
jgi:hypothetical protein